MSGLVTDVGHHYLANIFRFDLTDNDWATIADFPGPTRVLPYGFSVNGMGFIGAGHSLDGPGAVPLYDFYSYSAKDNEWTQIGNFTGTIRGSRYQGFAHTIGSTVFCCFAPGQIYSFGGNPAAWTKISETAHVLLTSSASFVIEDKIYIVESDNSVWEYSTSSDTWLQKSNFPGPSRWGGVGISIDNTGYIGLGKNASQYHTDFWKYSQTADSWSFFADMPGEGRVRPFFFTTNQHSYIGGGLNSRGYCMGDFYIFHPEYY